MLFDLNAFGNNTSTRNYDVCISGAGPAGITIARILASAGKNVALFEGGGLEFTEASQDLYHGKNIGKTFITSIEEKLSIDTINKMSLRVSLKNYPALRFWLANGFTTILHFNAEQYYSSESNAACFVLGKQLPSKFIHIP